MPDYRSFFDSEWLRAWDLNDRQHVVVIDRVEKGSAYDQKSRGNKSMPVIRFRGAKKPFGVNKTNCKVLANLYGRDTRDWIGKPIEIYPTTTQVGGDSDVPCIRMRAPRGKAEPMQERTPETEQKKETGALGIERCNDGKCGVCDWCMQAAKDLERIGE